MLALYLVSAPPTKLLQPVNISVPFVTAAVLHLPSPSATIIVSRFVQFWNMWCMSVTLLLLKLERSNDVNRLFPANIPAILVTLDVSKLDTSIERILG